MDITAWSLQLGERARDDRLRDRPRYDNLYLLTTKYSTWLSHSGYGGEQSSNFYHWRAGLWEVVPQALESVKGSLICKYWESTQRILQAYREGAVFGDAHCGERYTGRSHRVNKLTLGIDHHYPRETFN